MISQSTNIQITTMPDQTLNKNLPKLIKIVELMTGEHGVSIEELEHSLGVKRRSVFRLIKTLEEDFDFPVKVKRKDFGGVVKYFLPAKCLSKLTKMAVPSLSLNYGEVTMLQILLAHDTIFKDTKMFDDIKSLKKKLNNFLPKEQVINSQLSNTNFFISSSKTNKSYKGKEQIISDLKEAITEYKSCKVTYHAIYTGTVKTYVIHPLKILEHQGGFYVIVKVPKHDSIVSLAIERIQSLELLNKKFYPLSDSEIKMLIEMAFNLNFQDPITAKIRFSSKAAPFISERRWSNRQSIENHKDGSCTLTLTTSGKNDLMNWILSWGSDAEVLSPDFFRKMAAEKIEQMRKKYVKTDKTK